MRSVRWNETVAAKPCETVHSRLFFHSQPSDTLFITMAENRVLSARSSNFLKWTGHHRAISVAFAMFMLGCLMVLAVEPLEWVDIMRPVGPWVLLTGFALAVPAFVGLCVFIRCPQCRVPLMWHAVSKHAHPLGIKGILLAPKCPFCGFGEPTVMKER